MITFNQTMIDVIHELTIKYSKNSNSVLNAYFVWIFTPKSPQSPNSKKPHISHSTITAKFQLIYSNNWQQLFIEYKQLVPPHNRSFTTLKTTLELKPHFNKESIPAHPIDPLEREENKARAVRRTKFLLREDETSKAANTANQQ